MEAFQCFMFTFFIFPIAVFVIWNNYKVGQRHNRWVERFKELEQLPGWEAPNTNEAGRFGYQVGFEGLVIELDWFKHSERFFLRARYQLASTTDLAMDVQYNFGLLDRIIGPDEQLGDESFDGAVEIEGDEVQVTALLTSRAREAMQGAVADGVTIKEGCFELVEETSVAMLARAQEVVARVGRPALVLSGGGSSPLERLRENLEQEMLPGVRARNLGMLLLHYPEEEVTKRSLQAELLRGGHPSGAEGAITLAQEEALIAALQGPEDGAIAVITVLERCGTVPSIPGLRAFATQPEKDYRWRLAHQAISAIQERVGPIEGGGLSLSEVPVGALSEVAAGAGAVSVVESDEETS
jgi:hypothetical protein